MRIRRQERLRKWREQKKREEEEEKSLKIGGGIAKGHETTKSMKEDISMSDKRMPSAAASSPFVGGDNVKMSTTTTIIGTRKGGTMLHLGGRKAKASGLSAAWEADAEDDEDEGVGKLEDDEKKKKEEEEDYRGIPAPTITNGVGADHRHISVPPISKMMPSIAAGSESVKEESPSTSSVKEVQKEEEDPLDAFMTTLEKSDEIVEQDSIYDIGMGLEDGMRKPDAARIADVNALGSNTITLDELLGSSGEGGKKAMWESDTGGDDSGIEDDETPEQRRSRVEREEKEKADFIEALRRHDATGGRAVGAHKDEDDDVEKSGNEVPVEELGRMWAEEGDVMEEHERKNAEKDALQVCDALGIMGSWVVGIGVYT